MSEQTTDVVRDRCNQIAWTAHRVIPTEVGKWEATYGPILAAESVVIAPADLMWLIAAATANRSNPPAQQPGGRDE